jgi:hypothetical protein
MAILKRTIVSTHEIVKKSGHGDKEKVLRKWRTQYIKHVLLKPE